MIKYQNFKHFKLPVTTNPLDYGKLIILIEELKLYVVQVNRTSVALINEYDDFNKIKIFYEGDFKFEYTDHKINENEFIRSLDNKKFTFKNEELSLVTAYSFIREELNQLFSYKIVSLDYQINKQYNNTYKIKLNNV
jgi:hypothetical protein